MATEFSCIGKVDVAMVAHVDVCPLGVFFEMVIEFFYIGKVDVAMVAHVVPDVCPM